MVRYGDTVALETAELSFSRGERVFVLGKSGSGKTTLSNLIKGRLLPLSGRVAVLGGDPASEVVSVRKEIQRHVAMIDQEFHLVPRMTVVENILNGALGRVNPLRSLLGSFPACEWQRADEILGEVELEGLGHRRVETLSGGQRQRVAIGRALMQDAQIILADEPVSNLDPELAEDALELLVECSKRREVTLIVNLHQPRLAKRFASRVIGLYQGKVVYDGAPEELSADAEEFIYVGEAESSNRSNGVGHDRSSTTVA